MAADRTDRSTHFPAIEKKYGEPMAFWFKEMKKVAGKKYPEQIAHLRENFGFSQAHANAVVMYSRGQTSTKRYADLEGYLKTVNDEQHKTITSILNAITKGVPKSEVVIAWNQPMVKLGKDYLFGLSAARNHILIAPWGGLIDEFRDRLEDYEVNKKTIKVPNDWKVDRKLLLDMVKARVDQL